MARVLLTLAVAVLLVLLAAQGGAESVRGERPAGTLVFSFGTDRLMSIDVASGRRTARKVSSVAACGPQMFVTGGHVVFAGVRNARTVVFSAPVALDRRPTRLGTAHVFVPSATEGRVWLAGVTCTRNAMSAFAR
jgi:hypothetical protein